MGGGLSPSLACLAVEQGRALAGLFRKGTRSRELTWLMLTRATGAAPHRSGATLSVLARQGDHVGGLALQQRQQRGDLTAQLADLALLLAELGRELLTERRNVFADRLADDLSPELRQLAISRRRGRLVVLSVDLVHEVMRRSWLSLVLVLCHRVRRSVSRISPSALIAAFAVRSRSSARATSISPSTKSSSSAKTRGIIARSLSPQLSFWNSRIINVRICRSRHTKRCSRVSKFLPSANQARSALMNSWRRLRSTSCSSRSGIRARCSVMAHMIAQRHRRERHAHAFSLSSRTEPPVAEVADQLLDGTPDIRLIIRVADTMRRAQSGDHPAHVDSH